MTEPFRRMAWLAAIGTALVALVVVGLAVLTRNLPGVDEGAGTAVFMASICAAGLLWLLAAALVRRGAKLPSQTIWIVLAVAVAMRGVTLAAPPLLSTDLYRYIWDGNVQLAGISPYRYVPAAPELAFLRDDAVFPRINRAGYAPTIYPPAAEMIFALAAAVTPGVTGMRLTMALFDALTVGALAWLLPLLGRDRPELLIYAWAPLPVWEFAGNAHVDAMAAGLLALAFLLAVRGRVCWTGVVLAVAALTKFLPAVVFPAFWRPPDWRLPAAFAATVAALYLPYAVIGWRVLGFLPGYATEEGFTNGRGIFVLDLLGTVATLPMWASKVYIVVALGGLGLLGARFAFGGKLPAAPSARLAIQARQAVILGAAVLVAVSPHYPWYFGWLAPLACLAPLSSVLWMLAAAPLLAHGSLEYLAVPGAVYGPAAVLAVFDLRRHGTRTAAIPPQAVRSTQ